MARAVIGGLVTSSLLTLVVVPVVYIFFDDLGGRIRRRLTRREREVHAAAPEPLEQIEVAS